MLNCLTRMRIQDQAEQPEWVAYELHDGTCQYLAAAQMLFETFRKGQSKPPIDGWGTFDMGVEFLHRANEELRRLVCGLRPIHLAVGNLPKAIECLITEVRAAGGPRIELCCDIQPDQLPARLELAVFRIVQESLANACRHSKSKDVLVGLSQDEESFCIQVQDWGAGFDLDHIPEGHCGIEGIRQRVKLLGGVVTIQSNPGEGTLITVELPLKE